MTNASIALVKFSGRAASGVNVGMIPQASFQFIVTRRDTSAPIKQMLLAETIVARLRDGGLPVSCLADIFQVERKTVYAWLDGSAPRDANVSRIMTLHGLLGDGRVNLRSLHRVWNRRLEHGYTIQELLTADEVSVRSVEDALQMLAPSLKLHSERDGHRESRRGGWSIPLLDEMPTVGSRE